MLFSLTVLDMCIRPASGSQVDEICDQGDESSWPREGKTVTDHAHQGQVI